MRILLADIYAISEPEKKAESRRKKMIKKIKEAIAKELEGSYQKRVDYDKVKEDDADGDVQNT